MPHAIPQTHSAFYPHRFRFAERNEKKFADVVIIETQSMSMIKVEFTISVKMSKKN